MPGKPLATMTLMATWLFVSSLAHAETAAESFAEGERLLASADFAAAMEAYAAAARADRSNPEYVQHYAMVRRVLELRKSLPTEPNPQRWEYTARALRVFYASEGILPELLKLDQELHTRLATADSAALLADTQLAVNQNADAVATLTSLEAGKTNEKTQAILGIALARSGQIDRAKQIAQELRLPNDATPSLKYAAARLAAATGDMAQAAALLKACFEATLPSQLDGFKAHAKVCPEFAVLASTPEFVSVLATRSQIPESKCSGGGNCANCPMKGKCPASQGK